MAQPCYDPDPEANAGGLVNDGWSEPASRPGTLEEYDRLAAQRTDLIADGVSPDWLVVPLRPGEVNDGALDSGPVPGQPT